VPQRRSAPGISQACRKAIASTSDKAPIAAALELAKIGYSAGFFEAFIAYYVAKFVKQGDAQA
jgi:hypothetical protein